MIFLIILLYILSIFISRYILKSSLSFYFLTIFQTWFFSLLFLSTLNPLSLKVVSFYTYFLLIINILFFTIGYLISRFSSSSYPIILKSDSIERINSLKTNRFYLLSLIIFSLLIFNYLLRYNEVILLEGVSEARSMRFYVGKVFYSQIEVYFYNYVIETFSIYVAIYLAASFVWKKYDLKFILSILFVFLYSSFGSGRGYVIEIAFLICFLVIVKNFLMTKKIYSDFFEKGRNRNRIPKYLVSFVLMIVYLFAIYLSNLRNGLFEISLDNFLEGNQYFANQIIIYCLGSFRALDYGINNLYDQFPIMFGRLNFGGLDELLAHFLNLVGIEYMSGNGVYGFFTVDNFNIGSGIEYNALFTAVFAQYLDFGFLGVVIFSFIWGFVFNRVILSFEKEPSLNKLFVISFLFIVCIGSTFSWRFQSPSACLLVMYFLLKDYKFKFYSSS